tara:strand:+ start:541 stop:1248 length:708 start_codon:yes stop_codon:yes gene_type:complete
MKIKFLSAIAALGLMLTVLSLPAKAVDLGLSIGVMGSMSKAKTTGTETETTGDEETTTTSFTEDIALPAGFVEINLDFENGFGIALGGAAYPGTAEIGDKARTDVDTVVSSDDDDGTYKAKAEVSNLMEIYLAPMFMINDNAGIFVKGGMARIKVQTLEAIAFGEDSSTYGDETVNGTVWGAGIRLQSDSGIFMKAEYNDVDFDTVTLTSSTGNQNKIDADPSLESVMFSVGYKF